MYIHHTRIGTGGIITAHHGLIDALVSPALDEICMRFASWPSEAERLAGQAPIDRINIGVIVGALDLSGGLVAALEAAVLASDDFIGGSVVIDAADTLEGAKQRKRAELLEARSAAELAPIESGGRVFDGDLAAQRRIVGANVAALVGRVGWLVAVADALATAAGVELPEPPVFELAWTDRDDETVVLDEAGVFGLGVAALHNVDDAFCLGREVFGDLAAAEEVAEVLSIAWPA